jgi:hypothetical protein
MVSSSSSALLVGTAVGAAALAVYAQRSGLISRALDRRSVPELFEVLAEQLRDIAALEGTAGLLSWDEMVINPNLNPYVHGMVVTLLRVTDLRPRFRAMQVMMPPEAASARGKQKAALAGVLHDKATSCQLGGVLRLLTASDLSASSAFATRHPRYLSSKLPPLRMLTL